MKIMLNNFVQRQLGERGCESRFSYFSGSEENLINLVEENFDKKTVGYRDGVYLVPVPTTDFYTGISKIDDNSIIWSRMEARREGEEPVLIKSNLNGTKQPAKVVNVVLYSHDVLAENNENSTDADFEIISINASMENKKEPMTPETMMRNHQRKVGGTSDLMSEEEFQKKLKESMEYWNNYSTVDTIESFKKFYGTENIKELILENCSCKNPKAMRDFIFSTTGEELTHEDVNKIKTF